MQTFKAVFVLIFFSFLLIGCGGEYPKTTDEEDDASVVSETEPVYLPVEEKLFRNKPEISGLTWFEDQLLMIPQFPNRFDHKANGAIPYLEKDSIVKCISGEIDTLRYSTYQFIAPGMEEFTAPGSGYEAAAVVENDIWFTIESVKGISTTGFIVKGEIDKSEGTITLFNETLTEIKQVVEIYNFSDESVIYSNQKLLTIYEANGANVNPYPVSHIFSPDLDPLGAMPFPTIEYRITDATAADNNDRFWAINYFYPGEYDQLNPAVDSLVVKFGTGKTHLESRVVERIVEFQVGWDKIRLTQTPPVILKLREDQKGRNWEGIVKLEDHGFILATDSFPENLIGFIRYNFNDESNSEN